MQAQQDDAAVKPVHAPVGLRANRTTTAPATTLTLITTVRPCRSASASAGGIVAGVAVAITVAITTEAVIWDFA